MSSLIRIYTVGKFNCFMSGTLSVNINLMITCLSLVCVIHCWSCTPTGGATIVSRPIKIICFVLRVSAYCGALKVTVICKINVRAGFVLSFNQIALITAKLHRILAILSAKGLTERPLFHLKSVLSGNQILLISLL